MVIFKFIQIGILAIFASKNFSLAKESLPAGLKTKILAVYGSSAFSLVFDTLPLILLSSYGAGSITSLAYAQLLASIPSLLLVEQTHQLLGVRFFELGASKDIKHINESFEITLDCLMIFLIPLCTLLWMIGGDLFQLIFGSSFEPSLLINIKCLFNLLIWIPPLMVINGFTSQVLLGQHHTVSNAVQQMASTSLGIGMLFFFINRDGVVGYGKGMVYFYLLNVVAVGFTCALVMRDFALFRGLYRGFWKGILLGVVSLIFAELGNRFFGSSNTFIQLLTVGGFFCVGYLTGLLIIDRTL
jgi:O-antigen/teichoic acid export membrane protein